MHCNHRRSLSRLPAGATAADAHFDDAARQPAGQPRLRTVLATRQPTAASTQHAAWGEI